MSATTAPSPDRIFSTAAWAPIQTYPPLTAIERGVRPGWIDDVLAPVEGSIRRMSPVAGRVAEGEGPADPDLDPGSRRSARAATTATTATRTTAPAGTSNRGRPT